MSLGRRVLQIILLENLGTKLLSLAFATLLWMMVVGEKRTEMSLTVPVELEAIPNDLVIVSRVPESVRVRLNGPRTVLAAMNAQQLSVLLDLNEAQPGTNTFENLGARMRLPKRVEVTYVSPSAIPVEVDRKARKTVVLRPRLKGELAAGYRVASVLLEPSEVEVEGAERTVRSLREVPTEVVDVSGLDESFDRYVEPTFAESSLRRVTKRPVELRVAVEEIKADRELRGISVAAPGRRWKVAPATVDVRLEGGVRTLSRLSAQDISASVEDPGRGGTRGAARVVVRVPAGVRVLGVVPRAVEVLQLRPASLPALEAGPAGPEGTGD